MDDERILYPDRDKIVLKPAEIRIHVPQRDADFRFRILRIAKDDTALHKNGSQGGTEKWAHKELKEPGLAGPILRR